MEVSRYYPEFPECQEIKRMYKQWIAGPFLRFFEWAWVRGYHTSDQLRDTYHVSTWIHLPHMEEYKYIPGISVRDEFFQVVNYR